MIYYLLYKERKKLKRLYHRLILAMNFALLPLAAVLVWRPFAMPEGTPYSAAASGTIQTCTASGFLFLVLTIMVPLYYSSLSLQAFVSTKNGFKEDKTRWIEKYIHVVAWCVPCTISSIFAAGEYINPVFQGCYAAASPLGCESDPDLTCERGKDLRQLNRVLSFVNMFIYFAFTPSMLGAIYCLIGKTQHKMSESTGMHQIRASARKQMMTNCAMQILSYYFTWVFTWMFSMAYLAYYAKKETAHYNLAILSNCGGAIQGFAFAVLYFRLQTLGRKEILVIGPATGNSAPPRAGQHTVKEIRENAERSANMNSLDVAANDGRKTIKFSIFDGTPDQDSPWARFMVDAIDEEDESSCDVDAP